MKLIRTAKEKLLIHLGHREKEALLAVLRGYPCIPSGYQSLTKSATLPEPEASQKLLEESLAEHRAENQRLLEALLSSNDRLVQQKSGWRLALTRAELEWLLQVLNDVRVGNWLILGAPEERLKSLDEQTAPHYWAMEAAGAFQMEFLQCLETEGG